MPNISAESWAVIDVDSGSKLIFGRRADAKREVASLTKLMTFYVAWQLTQKLFPEHTSLSVTVPHLATKVIGTRAKLRPEDTLTVE